MRTLPSRTTLFVAVQRGFTLLELLVTLVIISVVMGLVGFSVGNSAPRTLKTEAEKLAARLNAAQAQLAAGAASLRLVATESGYAFESLKQNAQPENSSAASPAASNDLVNQVQWQPLADDDVLKPRSLPSGATLTLERPLRLSREPVSAPMLLRLRQADTVVTLTSAGIGGWQVQ